MSSLSYLIAFLSIFLLVLQPISSLDFLSPIVDTFKEPVCLGSVACGKGTCTPSSSHIFGFKCECIPGWKRTFTGGPDEYAFLPCVIPNCTILDSTCTKDEMPDPLDKEPVSSDTSIFNPCHWAYCGEGTCTRQGIFGHSCQCKPGAANLFRDPDYPCFSKCSLGTDCLGFGPSSPPGVVDPTMAATVESHASSVLPGKMLWKVISTVIIAMNLWN
ncbi:hypothetical protein ACHQM5_014678 [Ranunculus cassubicifolius]